MRYNGLKGLSLSIESLDFCDVVGGVVLDDPGFSVCDFVNGTFESIEHEIGPTTFAVTSLGRTAAVVQNALVGAIVVDDPFGTVKDIVFGVGGVVQRKAGGNVFHSRDRRYRLHTNPNLPMADRKKRRTHPRQRDFAVDGWPHPTTNLVSQQNPMAQHHHLEG